MTRSSPSPASFLVAFFMVFSTSIFPIIDAYAPRLGLLGRPKIVSNFVVCQYADTNDNNHEQRSGSSDVKYVFISMEEAEQALRHERTIFDKERQEMRGILEDQRRQLEELASRQVQRHARSSKRKESSTTIVPPDPVEFIQDSDSCSSPTSIPSSSSSKTAPHDQPMKWTDTESGVMQLEKYHEQLRNIENQLGHVMGENDRLMKRLQDQHRNFQGEKRELQERIIEERERLTHLREELNMERAYFETSRKLLENLLETEQKKVMSLQEELFSRDLLGRQFARGGGIGPDAARIHEEFATFSNGNQRHSSRRAGNPRCHPGHPEGLEMNLNDIRSPLYP
jgi:hypothetical protein